jgi:hypothetical protein
MIRKFKSDGKLEIDIRENVECYAYSKINVNYW